MYYETGHTKIGISKQSKDHDLLEYLAGSFEFYGQFNTIKVMSNMSVYLTSLLLGRLSPLSVEPVLVHISEQLTCACAHL